ncbi:SLAM family member 5 [Chelonia mydas]|uniref:SLAM family member 5 n=1 Tax=Chelonia mydas TaxID=8469 RepID=M7B2Q7_CHEMY|nr:SLAM family member 5 [Chelonia mydas]
MDLSQEDTGTYTAQIATEGTTEAIFQRFALHVSHQRYRERLRVLDGGHSLQIMDLSQEDTGTYTAQIATEGTTEAIFQRFALHVSQRLTESDINIVPGQDSVRTVNGTCNVTLNCSLLGGGEDVTYTWTQTAESSVVSTGTSIPLSHRLGSGVSPVTCMARNPVSNSSKSISPQEVCEGNILQQGFLLQKILFTF